MAAPAELIREVSTIHLEGNITPHTWYKRLRYPNGKPHLPAITILSDIVYWYRPTVTKDERGKAVRYTKRFEYDRLYKNYADYEKEYGLTKRQARDAIDYLRDIGVITTELRNMMHRGTWHSNMLFIEIVPSKLRELCLPPNIEVQVFEPEQDASALQGRPCDLQGRGSLPTGQTYTETTSETTQNILFADAPADARPTPKKPGRPKRPAHPQHADLMRRYQDALGYRIPNGAAEGKAASQLLNDGYSADHIIACYEWMKRDKFFSQMNHISLASVAKQIGAWLQKRGIQTQAVTLRQMPLGVPQLTWLVSRIRQFDITDDRAWPYQEIQEQGYLTPEQYSTMVAQGMPKTQPTLGAD